MARPGPSLACVPTLPAREAAAERMLAGQGTAALELIREHGPFDALLTPDTICDGLRGPINFALLQRREVEVLPLAERETVAAMRLLWERLKRIIEPSSATVLAAVPRYRERFGRPPHRLDSVRRQCRSRPGDLSSRQGRSARHCPP